LRYLESFPLHPIQEEKEHKWRQAPKNGKIKEILVMKK
jgi:hypothetical protein